MQESQTHTVYIAIGTNLGKRRENLANALTALAPDVQIEVVSPIYQTKPWGLTFQPDFLNLVCRGTTDLFPPDLLQHLKAIEVHLGRQRGIRFGPRLIDLDIIYYDSLTWDTDDLVIPHPRMHQRAFVLVPLNDLAPDLIHPGLEKTTTQLLEDIDLDGIQILE